MRSNQAWNLRLLMACQLNSEWNAQIKLLLKEDQQEVVVPKQAT